MTTSPPESSSLTDREISLRLLIETVRDYAIFMLDPRGIVRTWNAGAERIKGYKREEIIGHHFSCFYPAEAIARRWPEHELELAALESRFEDEGWRLRKDGSRFWANVVITAVRDEAGRLLGFGKVTRDLTERRRADEALRESYALLEDRVRERTVALEKERQRLHITLTSIGDGAIATDGDGCITLMNPVAEALTGWQSAEAVGLPLDEVLQLVNEETRSPVETPVKKVLATGTIVGLANHTVLIRRDGSERPIEDSAAPILDEQGRALGVVMIFRDASERRQAEELQLRLAAIVESSQDAIIGKTLAGIITNWNLGAERLYGYSAAEVIGRPITLLVPPEQKDEIPSIMARIRRGLSTDHFETVRLRRDGVRVCVSLVVSPIKTEDGRLIGASAIARDITAQKEAERQLLRSNAELQEADRRKNQFLAMLAHELRNPLASVRNALHVVRQPHASHTERMTAQDIMDRQLQHLSRLIDDLLDVSRVTQDRIELRREPTDLSTLIARSIETAQPALQRRRQQLALSIPPDPVPLEIDLTRMVQALSNLLHNAAKFSPENATIDLRAVRDDDNLQITVTDPGIGISEQFLPYVFDLFSQADQSLDRTRGGLGIGLTLVRKLVMLHGGSVSAHSAGPGSGSTFTIRLPFPPQSD